MRTLYVLWTYLRVKYLARFKSRKALAAWQHKKIRSHLRFLRRTSMMARFDELNTVGLEKAKAFELALAAESSRDFNDTLSGVTVGLSSGTSGNRGLFCVSPAEIALWTGQILARALPGSLLERHRVALFLRANSKLYESTSRSRIRFRFFDMLESMDAHIAALGDFAPTVLVAPPSILRMLARRQMAGQLAVSPKRIYAAAEVLEAQDASFIEAAFGLRVDQIYQATEGFLGISCSAHSQFTKLAPGNPAAARYREAC